MINKIQQHYITLVTAASPLPQVLRRRGLVKLWLFKLTRERLYLLAGLIFLLLAAEPFSQGIVDYLYPLDQGSFKNTIANLFNSPKLRKLEELRDTRYFQLFIFFWGVGFVTAAIVLILDLPRSVKQAERKALDMIQQSQEISSSNPLLSETLTTTANSLLLEPTIPKEVNQARDNSKDIVKTKAMKKAAKPVRYAGANQRYRIEKALASGGSGVVYQAQDTVLERKVALKELLENLAQDQEQKERFKVEARALALLNHPHILPVYDLLEESGRLWLVMELLTGGTLGDRIANAGRLDIDESIDIIKGIASGLGFAHQQGFVHRDIKPENILFGSDGSCRITDFGIAKHQSATTKTAHGLILGSPGYMSPEQASGENVDRRSDIYSLGITMFQMVTGELPFQGDTSAVMAQHITKQADPPSSKNDSVGKELDAVILIMLEKSPDDRYQSAQELIDALNNFKIE
jgi:serine/threonine-protein kinase